MGAQKRELSSEFESEVAWKVARFGRFMVPVSQFPISVIAIFICRALIWLVFQFFLGVIVNSSCDTEEVLSRLMFFCFFIGFARSCCLGGRFQLRFQWTGNDRN